MRLNIGIFPRMSTCSSYSSGSYFSKQMPSAFCNYIWLPEDVKWIDNESPIGKNHTRKEAGLYKSQVFFIYLTEIAFRQK